MMLPSDRVSEQNLSAWIKQIAEEMETYFKSCSENQTLIEFHSSNYSRFYGYLFWEFSETNILANWIYVVVTPHSLFQTFDFYEIWNLDFSIVDINHWFDVSFISPLIVKKMTAVSWKGFLIKRGDYFSWFIFSQIQKILKNRFWILMPSSIFKAWSTKLYLRKYICS